MNETKEFEFEGHPLVFRKIEGEWWSNAEEAAAALGYANARKILNLYARHQDEFLPTETCVLTLRTQLDQARAVRLFSPRGLEHLAILGRTATCRRFRRWILDEVLAKLHGGARVVTEEQLADAVSRIRGEVARQYACTIAALSAELVASRKLNLELVGIARLQASHAGRLLAFFAHHPTIREAAREEAERRSGQRRLPWPIQASGEDRTP